MANLTLSTVLVTVILISASYVSIFNRYEDEDTFAMELTLIKTHFYLEGYSMLR